MKIFAYNVKLFNDDPVITEYQAYKYFKIKPLLQNINYLAVPWAVLINTDKFADVKIKKISGGFSICQHVRYKEILPILHDVGIDTLFAPHVAEDHGGIRVLPFPHYAVNGTLQNPQKDIFYSFIGLDSTSLIGSNLRREIFNMDHPVNSVIKERRQWHWDRKPIPGKSIQEREKQEKLEYQDVLARSRFSLCPRGYGPSTIRFWESLMAGAIPVLLADAMRLPGRFDWASCIIRLKEEEVLRIPSVLRDIPLDVEKTMRERCIAAYNLYCGDNLTACIREVYETI